MNLLFFTRIDGDMIAVNPETIIMVNTGEAYIKNNDFKKEPYTALTTNGIIIRVKEPFDKVVEALNNWRKKA